MTPPLDCDRFPWADPGLWKGGREHMAKGGLTANKGVGAYNKMYFGKFSYAAIKKVWPLYTPDPPGPNSEEI